MLETTITLVGNLVDDPQHRFTPSGASVCTFRLASTPRRFDRSENRWVDGATLFLRVSCWRQLADNVSASLARGDRALVYGRLRQRSFETGEGERRLSYEIDADAVGAELTWHAARSERLGRRPSEAPQPEVSGQTHNPVHDQADLARPMPALQHAGFDVAGSQPYSSPEGVARLATDVQAPMPAPAAMASPAMPSTAMPSTAMPSTAMASTAMAPTGSELIGAAAAGGYSVPGAMRGEPDVHSPLSGLTAGPGVMVDDSRAATDLGEPAWRPFPSSDDLR